MKYYNVRLLLQICLKYALHFSISFNSAQLSSPFSKTEYFLPILFHFQCWYSVLNIKLTKERSSNFLLLQRYWFRETPEFCWAHLSSGQCARALIKLVTCRKAEGKKKKYIYIYMCVCVYVCVYIYVCICVCIYMCIYVCVYIYVYICVCVYICVYIYIFPLFNC